MTLRMVILKMLDLSVIQGQR
uniref:Uncharacterized protein n=1 Tax=Anguilla anguilla TaxID=7936 RepID=A0A0E9SA39_ANGAN